MDGSIRSSRNRDAERDRDRRHDDDARAGAHPRGRHEHGDPPRGERRPDGHEQRPRRMSGASLVDRAKAQVTELTGHECEAVSSLTRTPDGWRVVVEVVELERVPSTTDILASYVVELDRDGELMSYQRTQRYYRNDVSAQQ